ncbi:hypothetical protein LAZ67_2005872 [Cordylochernes scorpioides]|uniref:DUF5641 domain-containing protein n=1 Tax=Cordylochernes scorpioides TaxID=51811 RepID=A0ABY6K4T6_9ARAC|nr:hypothetical protein LAZ67_2005872 [Cordylochernes scorpioides]
MTAVGLQTIPLGLQTIPLSLKTMPRHKILILQDVKLNVLKRFQKLQWKITGRLCMNRVMEIRSLSETEDWCRVPGCLNPADLPSRGCLADSLERSKWWEGPSWLRRPRRDWPHREIYPDPDIVNSEKRKIVLKSTQLKGLTRRRSKTRPIKVGDLVLIGQDNAKRVNWPLARVVEVYPGRDGPVRVAKLRTSKGVQIRPVQRLYNLEIPADLGSTLRSIQSEPRRGGSRGEASEDPAKMARLVWFFSARSREVYALVDTCLRHFYLKAYLGGTAAQTVEGFCLSEENYDKAVELLKKRFGKRERLIDVHMNNLLALKPLRVTKDVGAFRELYGRILVQIRSLESLGVVVESYGNLLCPLLLKLLPSDLKFELHREFTGAFSLGDLIEFLERQLIALESTFGTRDEITAGQPSNEHPQSQSSIVKYRRNERNPLPTAAGFLNVSEADKEKVLDVEQGMDMRICDGSSLEIGMSEKPSVVGVTLMKGVDPASIKEDAEMVVSSEQMVKEPSKQIAVEESNKAQVVRERCAEDGEKAQVKKKSVVEVDESNRAEVEKESVEADKEKVLDVEQGMDSKNTEEVKLLYVKQGTDLRMAERPYAEQGNEPKEDGVQDSENEPKGDGVKDSEAETKDNEVEDSGTAIEACESVSNSKAVAEGADQVEIADGEAESIDDIEERVVRVPASSKLMEAGQIGDAEFKVKGYYLPDRPVCGCDSRAAPVRPAKDGASYRGRNGFSLKRYMKRIHSLLRRIPEIRIKLRRNKFGVVADLKRYFQMIAIRDNDWDYLKFLWKKKRWTTDGFEREIVVDDFG